MTRTAMTAPAVPASVLVMADVRTERDLLQAISDARVALLSATGVYERAIADAVRAGLPLSRIANTVGVSQARVKQIVARVPR